MVVTSPVTSVDFYPTLLQLAGLPSRPQQHVDGQTMVPLLMGEAADRGPIFWHYPHYGNQGGAPSAAVRMDQWKLIRWYEDGATELYDLGIDPGERYDLKRLRPDQAQTLAASLDGWLEDVDANMPSMNLAFDEERPSGPLPPDER